MCEAIYALLLRLYPAHFRRMYGEEALQLVRDRMRDEQGVWAKARLWWDLVLDLVKSAPREYGRIPPELAAAAAQRVSGVPSFWIFEDEAMRASTWASASIVSLLVVGMMAALMDQTAGHPLRSFAPSGQASRAQMPAGGVAAKRDQQDLTGQWQGALSAEPLRSRRRTNGDRGGHGMEGTTGMTIAKGALGIRRKWLLAGLTTAIASASPAVNWAQAPAPAGFPTADTESVRPWMPNAPKIAFDVASVRASKPGDEPKSNIPLGPGSVYVPNGGNFIAAGMPLSVYIMFAYKMSAGTAQRMEKQVPGWVMTEKYNITAKTDNHDVTKDEMRLMMRALLAERFKLAIHSETQQMPVYGLVLAKPGRLGPKLAPHSKAEPCAPTRPTQAGDTNAPAQTVPGGFPAICGGILGLPSDTPGMTSLGARDVPIGQLANVLAGLGNLGRPVQDQTGLTGTYDFVLEFARMPSLGQTDAGNDGIADSVGPGLEQALKQQLGLKLDSTKRGVEVWVVDHVEHPTEN